MSKPPDQSKFLAAIRDSELGVKILADIDAARLAERKAIVDELQRLNSTAEKDFPKLQAAQEKALAEYQELEKKLQAARLKVAQANGVKLSASAVYTARRDELERALVDGASPLISDFIEWCEDERARTLRVGDGAQREA